MAKYKLSKEAREDLIQIFRYGVVRFGQIQAEKYYDSLFEMFHFIAENPYLFKEVNKIRLGYRICVYKSHAIYYKVENDVVLIMALIRSQKYF